MKSQLLSHVQLFATSGTITGQSPLSMEFSRQEYRSGLPCPPPGDLPNTGIEPGSLALQADSLPSEPTGLPILYMVVYVCESQSPNFSLPAFPPFNHKFVFYICSSISVS